MNFTAIYGTTAISIKQQGLLLYKQWQSILYTSTCWDLAAQITELLCFVQHFQKQISTSLQFHSAAKFYISKKRNVHRTFTLGLRSSANTCNLLRCTYSAHSTSCTAFWPNICFSHMRLVTRKTKWKKNTALHLTSTDSHRQLMPSDRRSMLPASSLRATHTKLVAVISRKNPSPFLATYAITISNHSLGICSSTLTITLRNEEGLM